MVSLMHLLFVFAFFQTKCSVLPPGSAVSILRSIFQDVHVQVNAFILQGCIKVLRNDPKHIVTKYCFISEKLCSFSSSVNAEKLSVSQFPHKYEAAKTI